jgi:DNA helicase HerA-like ATPase
LAATGAGKTVTSRKILEGLIEKNYPLVIFDSHGDYIGLKDVFKDKVQVFVPNLNLADEDRDTIISYVNGLSGQKLTEPQQNLLDNLLQIFEDNNLLSAIHNLRNRHRGSDIPFDLASRHFHAIMGLAQALNFGIRNDPTDWNTIIQRAQQGNISINVQSSTYCALIRGLNSAGKQLNTIIKANRETQVNAKTLLSGDAISSIVSKGKVAIISLEGYSDEIKQTFVAKILQELLEHRINNKISRFLSVIEEAHNFIPSRSELAEGIVPSLPIIRRIATEGRKYGAGLIMISQRPSRIDSTILSMANSYIILKIINPGDQKYIRDVVESLGEEDAQLLPELAVGEALITGQCIRFPILARISQPRSKGKYEEEDFIKDFI